MIMQQESTKIEFYTNEYIINKTKKRLLTTYILSLSLPMLFMIYFTSLIEQYGNYYMLSLIITMPLLFLIVLIASRKIFKNLKNIKATLYNDKIAFISSHKNYSFELDINDITSIKPKYKKKLMSSIIIKTPYSTSQIYSIENIELLYQKLSSQVIFTSTDNLVSKNNEPKKEAIRFNKIQRVANILLTMLVIFFTYRFYIIRNLLNFDVYINLIEIALFFFIYLYFAINSVIKLITLSIYNKFHKKMIFQLIIYLGLPIYIAVYLGPRVLRILF